MQVTHVNDHVTHAVIGGKESIGFGISDSAEFFHILSSTLYSDQILAVVREVLCNAWDAHKDSGGTDQPLVVTLTQDKFVVQDFGHGIPHDMIGPIYGTYGNSTKKNDGKQTGGFGLGCKAPFAYTDHFEVTSCHKGEKNIYAMSRSSAVVGGKPEIKPIACFPTTDTGITVSMNIKPPDHRRFRTLIERIVFNGEMNVMFNGNKVEVANFSKCTGNYLITRNACYLGKETPTIMVRYGDVIYPVERNEAIADNYTDVVQHLCTLGSGRYSVQYKIVFLAPAHSIAVTPSRETLSMQEHTVNTLNMLFTSFMVEVDLHMDVECAKELETAVDIAVVTGKVGMLLSRTIRTPNNNPTKPYEHIMDVSQMGKAYMQYSYPSDKAFLGKDLKNRVTKLADIGLLDRGLSQKFVRNIVDKTGGALVKPSEWIHKNVFRTLISKLQADPELNHENLFVHDRNTQRYSRQTDYIIPAISATFENSHETAMSYLRKIVVLTKKMKDLTDRIYQSTLMNNLGELEGILIYYVGTKIAHLVAAKDFFNKQGMVVLDLTGYVSGDKVYTPKPKDAGPKRVGLPALSCVLVESSIDMAKTKLCYLPVSITNPEFIYKASLAKNSSLHRIRDFNQHASFAIAKLFGDKGGVVSSATQETKYKASGAIDLLDYVIEKVCTEMVSNLRIKEYYAFRPGPCSGLLPNNNGVFSNIHNSAVLRKEFGILNNLTKEDNLYLVIWYDLSKANIFIHDIRLSDQIKDTAKYLLNIPINQVNLDLAAKLNSSKYVSLLDMRVVNDNLFEKDKVLVANTLKLFHLILSE